jgi:hypothetical protein
MHQERLDARFSYAQALWLASSYVAVRRDRRCIQSQALLKTTAGIAAKRDILALCGEPNLRARRKLDPAWSVLLSALVGAVTVLLAIHSIAG